MKTLRQVTKLCRLTYFRPVIKRLMEIFCFMPNCVSEEFTSQISRNISLVAQQYVKINTKISNLIFFRERAEFNKFCDLIGSGSGRNFPIRPALSRVCLVVCSSAL